MIPRKLTLPLLLLSMAARCMAQAPDSTSRPKPALDTARPAQGYVMTKSPTTATLLAIVPGLGQVYNEQYWKIPVFALPAGWFIYRVVSLNSLFLQKSREADQAGRNSPAYPRLKLEREAYRDERDLNAAYLLGVEILGMIDAYVGAHLFDFDVGDDISSKLQIAPTGLGLSVRF
jgi:hypothetical protein